MLNNQQGSTLSDQEKVKGGWKQYTDNLYRRDKRLTGTFEGDYYEEEPVILESCPQSTEKKYITRAR